MTDTGLAFKGVPSHAASAILTADRLTGIDLLNDELMLPAAVLKASALVNNSRWMTGFANRHGLSLAPHGKTTMSRQLIEQQLTDGAWAITAATVHHARLYAEWCVPRILLANQPVGAANLAALTAMLAARSALDFYCLVDSVEGAQAIAAAARAAPLENPVNVLVELGGPGERTGARSLSEALVVARACYDLPEIALRGIECFEGVYADAASASPLLQRLGETAEAIASASLLAPGEAIVSAGGSALFDEAAHAMFGVAFGRTTRLVLRSGCYLVHDGESYERHFENILARDPSLAALGRLRPALEVWAHVQSRPEARRVVASLGKRDVGHDVLPPRLLHIYRPARDSVPQPAPANVSVAKLYDQHICLDVEEAADFAVGDLLAFGISHPCTTFDKWRALFVVDDDYRVVDIVETSF